MQSAREELRGRKPGEALSLSGRFKRKLNRPVLFLPSRTVHAVNISFQVPANQELTDWSKRPPRDTFWPKAWCWSEDHLFWCVSFYFQREAVAGLALTDANKTARHSGWKHLPAGVLYVLDFWKTKFLNPEKFPCRWVPLSFDSNNRMFRFFMLGCLFFFFFTMAVQNLLNQEIHLYTLKITCQCLQHLPPIQCSACSSWFCLRWAFIYFLLVFFFFFADLKLSSFSSSCYGRHLFLFTNCTEL